MKASITRKTVFIILSLLIILAGTGIYYFYLSKNQMHEEVANEEPAFTKNGELSFIGHLDHAYLKKIDIEIADNEAKRSQGLMWRRSMSENDGMLFIFDDENPRSFWMRNTYIALDIVFINKTYEIVSIRDNIQPLSDMAVPSEFPAKYVVELNSGFCNRFKIAIGDKIEFNSTSKIVSEP